MSSNMSSHMSAHSNAGTNEPQGRSHQGSTTDASRASTTRIAVLWMPDWPVYTATVRHNWDPLRPAAVLRDHRIYACNAAARKRGVKQAMRQRHALAACPELQMAQHAETVEAVAHEEVVSTMDAVAAHVETLRPGLLAFPLAALAKFYGSEEIAMEKLLDAATCLWADCMIGAADDVITAAWAAREGKIIAPGGSSTYLQHLPLHALTVEPAFAGPKELVETLSRLGIRTLGDFHNLPRSDVASRFGTEAVYWHRVISGEPGRVLSTTAIPQELHIVQHLDSPVNNVEAAAFVARQAAAELHNALFQQGLACVRLAVRAHLAPPQGYEGPTVVERLWNCQDPLNEADTAQRIRWQLDGWITRLSQQLTEAWEHDEVGIQAIALQPITCIPADHVDMPLWGGPDEGIRSARAAASRAQSLLGMQAVLRPIHTGGRTLSSSVITVAYGEEDPKEITTMKTRQWVGSLPAPLPSNLLETRRPAAHRTKTRPQGNPFSKRSLADKLANKKDLERNPSPGHPAAAIALCDKDGNLIHVTGRGMLSATPHYLRWGRTLHRITGWAGPWPVDEQWWQEGKRYARVQISAENPNGTQSGYLLVTQGTQWRIEATY